MMVILIMLGLISASPATGTATFDFLLIAPTAREAVVGSFHPAAGSGAFAFYYNPAQLLASTAPEAQFSYINYPAGVNAGSAAYRQLVAQGRGFGAGFYYLNSGTMKRTNEQGEELGTFGVSFASLKIAGAQTVADRIDIGLSLNGLYGSIDTFFTVGVAGDAGAVYRLPDYHLSIGAGVRNLGLQIKPFGDYRDPLPFDIALGAAWQPVPALSLGVGVHKSSTDRFRFGCGVEGWAGSNIILRAGYDSRGSDWNDGTLGGLLAGFAAGLGIRYDRYQVDYSFLPMGVLGFSHRLSLGFSL
uniref:PorV/PorQ family protein n=2 Tax=candidate division WOR-3 bacterium TaxID=2052148 RepID=A0A7C1SGT5_UNCW3